MCTHMWHAPETGVIMQNSTKSTNAPCCNTVASRPAGGITAMRAINDDDLTFSAKIFRNIMSFYHTKTNELLSVDTDEIETQLLDIMPCGVKYNVNSQNLPTLTNLQPR